MHMPRSSVSFLTAVRNTFLRPILFSHQASTSYQLLPPPFGEGHRAPPPSS